MHLISFCVPLFLRHNSKLVEFLRANRDFNFLKPHGRELLRFVLHLLIKPLNSYEWPRENFSLQYQYNTKQSSDENFQNLHHENCMADSNKNYYCCSTSNGKGTRNHVLQWFALSTAYRLDYDIYLPCIFLNEGLRYLHALYLGCLKLNIQAVAVFKSS